MKKTPLYIGALMIIVIGVMAYNYSHRLTGASAQQIKTISWQPEHLRIPKLNIDAEVINVGATSTGAMDIPVSQSANAPIWNEVFWYDRGAAPGQSGNSVMAGHVNRVGGGRAIFADLDQLPPGSDIFVHTVEGKDLHFTVQKMVRYPTHTTDQQALQEVFGSTTKHHLNLITCSGAWTKDGFDQRLVVFTNQVD